VFEAVVDLFRDHYWDAQYRDWDVWAESYRDDALASASRSDFDRVFRRMIAELDDDHSSWLGLPISARDGLGDTFDRPRLGAQLGFVDDVGLVVRRVLPGTPAADVELQRGDVITSINGEDVRASPSLGTALQLLTRASRAGDVTLEVERRGAALQLSVTPGTFLEAALASRPQADMVDENTGYLYLPTFRGDTVAPEAHRLIAELQRRGAENLILDLRGNLGGRLNQMGLVLGIFADGAWADAVSRGRVAWQGSYLGGEVLLEAPGGRVVSRGVVPEPVRFAGAVAVLVDASNSSAGEVAALALQDLGRATIIGEHTEGNVEALQTFELPDGSRVMVAIANLQGINGLTFAVGVAPDIVATEDLGELARGYDAPVAEALRVLDELPFTPGRFF
jgi:carboxyl-terminal processing protease